MTDTVKLKYKDYRNLAKERAVSEGRNQVYIWQWAKKAELQCYVDGASHELSFPSDPNNRPNQDDSTTLKAKPQTHAPAETSAGLDETPFDDSKPIHADAVNPYLPVIKLNKSHNGMLPNGRSAKGTPSFDRWFGKIFPSDVAYPAWKYLSKTSTDVANICKAKHDHAANCGQKDASGFPWFKFSFKEAVGDFKISRPTFDKSIKQLVAVGFLKYRVIGDVPQCGNFENGRGTPAQFQLSYVWKTWTPGMDEVLNPAARKKGKGPDKKQNPSKPVFTSTGKPTFTSKAE